MVALAVYVAVNTRLDQACHGVLMEEVLDMTTILHACFQFAML